MIGPLGRLAVRLAHEVVTEWRALDAPEPAPAPEPEPGRQEMSCVSASAERAASWGHDKRRPAVAAQAPPFGFTKGASS